MASARTDTLMEITRKMKTMRKSEQTAARFVLSHPGKVALLPLRFLAKECGVSEPTILRFCKGLGFNGFQDFKMSLIPQILQGAHGEVHDEVPTLAARLAKSVGDTVVNIDGAKLAEAAETVVGAERVIVAGLGGAAGVAYILADSLTGLGKMCFCSHDPSYLQVLPESLKVGDLVVGISHSGETEEITRLLNRAKANGAGTIAITNYESAPIDIAAGLTLFTSHSEDLLGSYSPAARVAELALITALIERVGEGLEKP